MMGRVARWTGVALSLALMMSGSLLAFSAPALALDTSSYFNISYSVAFSQDTAYPGESVTAVITGKATRSQCVYKYLLVLLGEYYFELTAINKIEIIVSITDRKNSLILDIGFFFHGKIKRTSLFGFEAII